MVEEKILVLIIILMTLINYLIRSIPLQIDSNNLPNWLKNSLDFIPISIISAITIPNILLDSYFSNFLTADFLTTIVVFLLAIYTKSLITTIFFSLLLYVFLNQYLLM